MRAELLISEISEYVSAHVFFFGREAAEKFRVSAPVGLKIVPCFRAHIPRNEGSGASAAFGGQIVLIFQFCSEIIMFLQNAWRNGGADE